MKRLLLLSAAALSFGLAAASAQDVPSGTYAIDPTHTTVIWSVSHGGFSFYRGSFSEVDGNLVWDAETPTESELSVTIGANSVISPAAISHAGNDNFQQDIGRNALGGADHPEITFTSKSLKRTGDETGVITGDLTLNGQTNEVEMDIELIGSGDFMGTPKLGFAGETVIDRTDFGSDEWVQFGIGSEVTITVQAEFAKVN
ncbi:MAG: YceI family protein [Pseudomonadota bacterium]